MNNHNLFYENSNGCKLLVKRDAMLDSLDSRSYDNSTNGINFSIRKVNLMFVFIVVRDPNE